MLVEPAQPHWPLLVAVCHRRTGNYAAALQIYRAAHQQFPDHLECLRSLTRLCEDLELNNEANRYAVKLRRAENTRKLVSPYISCIGRVHEVIPRILNKLGCKKIVQQFGIIFRIWHEFLLWQ